jgi:hypothetical protein
VLDSRTARIGLGATAVGRCAVGVAALVAPGAVRLAPGGCEPGNRTVVLTRFAGGRDLALGGALLTALAGVATDMSDAVTALAASRRWPKRRWLPSAATAVASAAAGAVFAGRVWPIPTGDPGREGRPTS